MTSKILRIIFHQPLKQWRTGRKRGEDGNTKFEYLKKEKSFLDEIKSIFHSLWRAIIWWKNRNLVKIAGTSFELFICSSDVKRPKSFMSFTLWTLIKAPLWIRCGAYSTLRPSPAFYNIEKLNLSSKNKH